MRSASPKSRAARSGSVAATAAATLAQRPCLRGLVGERVGDASGTRSWAARSGSVAATPAATPLSADAFSVPDGEGVGDALGVAEEPGNAGMVIPPDPGAFLYVSFPGGGITGRAGTVSTVGHGGGRRRQNPLNRRDQPPGIVTETLMPDTERVTAGQTGKAVRQVRAARHDRALHQDRDYPHLARKCRPDLQPDQVIGIIKPPPAPLISRRQPARADHRHQHHARIYRVGDRLREVHPRLNGLHVNEDLLRAETVDQAIRQPPGSIAALLPAVADKNATAPRCAHAQSRYRKAIPSSRKPSGFHRSAQPFTRANKLPVSWA